MAITECSECSYQLSSEAHQCPRCGALTDLGKKKDKYRQWVLVDGFTSIIFILGVVIVTIVLASRGFFDP